jgi:DNA-directed RNA polymerase specialized sigma24 family protein
MLMTPSDTALVSACQEGDIQAWERLVLRYQRLVYSIARQAGLPKESTANIFLRVFRRFVEAIHSPEQPEQVRNWLILTAQQETLRAAQLESGLAQNLQAEALTTLEEQQLVRQAWSELEQPCRQLLQLLFYSDEQFSTAQLAVLLHLAEERILPMCVQCLGQLRERLPELSSRHTLSIAT